MRKLGDSILRTCASSALRAPWIVLAVALAVTVLAGWATTRLTINTSTEEILAADLPFRQAERKYRAAFPEEDLAVVVVDAPASDQAEAAARALLDRVRQQSAFFKRSELAGSSPYFDRNALLFLDAEQIRAVGNQLRQARSLLLTLANDPSLRGVAEFLDNAEFGVAESAAPPELAGLLGQLADTVEQRAQGRAAEMQWGSTFSIGPDARGSRRIVQIDPVLDNTSIDRAGPALSALGEAMAEVRSLHPEVTMRLTGEPVLRQQELNDAFSGALYASGLSFVLVAATLIFGIRSGRMTSALLITLVVGGIWTSGLAAMTVGGLNLISVAFMVLFFGLGVDFGTHLGLRYLELRREGAGFEEAMRRAMTGEAPSITLSALAAALAFLSFVPTSYVGLAEFGIISALGMMVALVTTFTVLPALMAVMPPVPSPHAPRHIGLGSFIRKYYRPILVVAGIVTIGAAWTATQAQIDTNPLNLQNPNTEAVRTYRDLAGDPQTSPYALNVIAPNVEAARELAPRLAALDGVAGVRWVENFVPADQEAKLPALQAARERLGESFFAEEPPAPPATDAELQQAWSSMRESAQAIAATPPENPVDPAIPAAGARLVSAFDGFAQARGTEPADLRELGAALAGQMPALAADLRQKLTVAEPVTIEDIPPELRREWISPQGQVRLRVLPEDNIGSAAEMAAFTGTVQTLAPDAAGAPASVTGAGKAILRSFAQAILYTVIAIGLVVTIVRRRLTDVLLVLAPLAVAALWTVAGSAALDLPFNFANVIVIPLLIGLGVASSIHIVSRAREIEHEGPGADAGGVLGTSTPVAVLITQLNTVAAFATLAVAEHRGLFSMGVLLGLSILLVLIVSLVVLPAFMAALGVGSVTRNPSDPEPTS